MVPPRMRGLTQPPPIRERLSFGSPAYAGIDPFGCGAADARAGFPRVCGD